MSVLADAALTPDDVGRVLDDLVGCADVAEAMVLATCNRVEVYADAPKVRPAVEAITDVLAARTGLPRDGLARHLRVRSDEAAVTHLLSVTAGLESVVPGETQVLGQVRAALHQAQEHRASGRQINVHAQLALRTGKRVHTETDVAASGASIVSAALELAEPTVNGFANRTAVVVGAGAMGTLAAATLRRLSVGRLVMVNRTLENAERIAETHDGVVASIDDLGEVLTDADVVVTAVGSRTPLIDGALLRSLERGGRPLAIVDLGLPADTSADVVDVEGVVRVDLGTLHDEPVAHASTEALAAAHAIVHAQVAERMAQQAEQAVEPTLIALRAQAAAVVVAESAQLRKRLSDLDPAQLDEVERALRRAAAALLHTPTVRIKEHAGDPEGALYAEALRALFDLDVADAAEATGVVSPAPESDRSTPSP
jgi:glutamyl-tRNA reductase